MSRQDEMKADKKGKKAQRSDLLTSLLRHRDGDM